MQPLLRVRDPPAYSNGRDWLAAEQMQVITLDSTTGGTNLN